MKKPLPKLKNRKSFGRFVEKNDLGNYLEAKDLKPIMSWKSMTIQELAGSLGINALEVREKQKLIRQIIKARNNQKLSQAQLAKKVGVTLGLITKIESGIGTYKLTFDLLLRILTLLGYEFKIAIKKVA